MQARQSTMVVPKLRSGVQHKCSDSGRQELYLEDELPSASVPPAVKEGTSNLALRSKHLKTTQLTATANLIARFTAMPLGVVLIPSVVFAARCGLAGAMLLVASIRQLRDPGGSRN